MADLPSLTTNIDKLKTQDLPVVYVGVDKLFEDLVAFTTEQKLVNYPPFDVVKTDRGYDIVIAVAGFTLNDLTVELDNYGVLTVTGKKTSHGTEQYIHRGISKRQFTRKWNLNRDIHVINDITLRDGLLVVSIHEVIPTAPTTIQLTISQK